MAQSMPFSGFPADGYRFLTELEFYNEKSFVDANRARYHSCVRDPMRALAARLSQTALEIDPLFNTDPTSIVSRLNRDTRFSKNKLPYRSSAWLCFKHRGVSTGECFGIYFEIRPEHYSYGVGVYAPNTEMMAQFRARILAKPTAFLEYAAKVELLGMQLEGEMFKRDRFKDADEQLKPYLNRKSLGWSFSSTELKRTMEAGIADDLIEAFNAIRPLYKLLCGIE